MQELEESFTRERVPARAEGWRRCLLVGVARLARLLSMALWLGGFTFYSGVVVEILHGELDRFRTGTISQQVSDWINGIGLATLLVWWASHAVAGPGARWARRVEVAGLVVSSGLLVGLAVLHDDLDARIDEGRLSGFYAIHAAYLTVSAVQWGVNLVLLGLAFAPRWPSSGAVSVSGPAV